MKYNLSDICVVLVIYNTNYKKSDTLNKLINREELQLYVCDNSTSDYGNIELRAFKNVIYIDMKGNQGLSKAYNKAVEMIGIDKLVVLLDDDSILADDFFETILDNIEDNVDIYVPIVRDNVGILSPCINRNNKFFRYKDEMQINDDFSAINSGLVIKSEIYQNYRYDENLFLDYIDHNFIRSMKELDKRFKIMHDVCINQNFSQHIDSKESAKIRLRLLKKDLYYFYRNQKSKYYWTILKKKIHLCIIHKTIMFLFY